MRILKLLSLSVALVLTVFGTNANSQSICDGPRGCTKDQFAAEALWIAQDLVDKAQDESKVAGTRLSTCALFTTINIAEKLPYGKTEIVSQSQYRKWMTNLQDHLKEAPQWYRDNCEKSLTIDQFGNLLKAVVGSQREKTKFSSILSDPDAYRGKTFRVDGYGLFSMNTFYLKRSLDDMNPIVVDLDNARKGVREKLIDNCGRISSPCKLTVWGRTKFSEPLITVTMTGPIEWQADR